MVSAFAHAVGRKTTPLGKYPALYPGTGFPALIQRVPGAIVEVDDAPAVVGQNDEAEQQSEGGRRDDEEIAGDSGFEMILEKSPPGLRWRSIDSPFYVVGHGGLGHIKAEKSESGLDTRRAPCAVVLEYATDQGDDLGTDERAAALVSPGFTPPEESEAFLVPPGERFGLDDGQAWAPVRPEA